MGILQGIITTWTKNPPEEWDTAGNDQLIDKGSTRGSGFHRELPAYSRGIQAGKIKVRGKFFER
jgi:hypothetical protein